MTNGMKKVLAMTAETALEAALATLGLASHAGNYQPKAPEALEAYAKNASKNA